jgi:hypothetical protein
MGARPHFAGDHRARRPCGFAPPSPGSPPPHLAYPGLPSPFAPRSPGMLPLPFPYGSAPSPLVAPTSPAASSSRSLPSFLPASGGGGSGPPATPFAFAPPVPAPAPFPPLAPLTIRATASASSSQARAPWTSPGGTVRARSPGGTTYRQQPPSGRYAGARAAALADEPAPALPRCLTRRQPHDDNRRPQRRRTGAPARSVSPLERRRTRRSA